jgi:hypothetical protein
MMLLSIFLFTIFFNSLSSPLPLFILFNTNQNSKYPSQWKKIKKALSFLLKGERGGIDLVVWPFFLVDSESLEIPNDEPFFFGGLVSPPNGGGKSKHQKNSLQKTVS